MKTRLTIGTRGSRLALWQSESVKAQLESLDPQLDIQLQIIKTSGDVLKNESLTDIGGRGVFTKELEEALLDRRIDLAVHSLKDLPTTLHSGLTIAAIMEREDARDALVLRADHAASGWTLAGMPSGSVIGTSSPRRIAQLKSLRSDLEIKELRGNVDTRLRKLDAGTYDAIVLASAGLRRLGFNDRISVAIEPAEMLPAVGQGALAVETREEDVNTKILVGQLDHSPTRAACTAERSLLRALGGGCQLPIAAYAIVNQNNLRLEALVAAPSGSAVVRDLIEGPVEEAANLGERLAESLSAKGARALLFSSLQESQSEVESEKS